MTLQEMLQSVDELSSDELDALQERINQRRAKRRESLQPLTEEEAMRQIREILKDAEPVELVIGTMDVDKLMQGIDAIREGLTQQELDEIAEAMNEEYIEPDKSR